MTQKLTLTLAFLLCGCAGTLHDPTGHYVLTSPAQPGRYLTLDVEGNQAYINRSSVFENQRDTLALDDGRLAKIPEDFAGRKVTSFQTVNDSIYMTVNDGGVDSKLVFVRTSPTIRNDHFANSLLAIQLSDCEVPCRQVSNVRRVKHLLVGKPKEEIRSRLKLQEDSVVLEFQNALFIQYRDLKTLLTEMAKAEDNLCLQIDKGVPAEKVSRLKKELAAITTEVTILEGRMKGDEVVFVRSTSP